VTVDFSALVNEVHHRRTFDIGVPAVTRHLAYWWPIKLERLNASRVPVRTQISALERREPIIDRYLIRNLIQNIYRADRNFSIPNNEITEKDNGHRYISLFKDVYQLERDDADADKILFTKVSSPDRYGISKVDFNILKSLHYDSHREITFIFRWNSIPATIRVSLHTEYITISISLDISVKGDSSLFRQEVLKYLMQLSLLLSKARHSQSEKDILGQIHKYLYFDVWDTLFKEVFDANRVPIKTFAKESGGFKGVSSLFVDFRRLILASPVNASRDGWPLSRPSWLFEPPFSQDLPDFKRFTDCDDHYPQIDGIHIKSDWRPLVRRLWPFLTIQPSLDEKQYEAAVTGMLRGRVLHISTLGQRSFPPRGRTPLCSLLYSSTLNPSEVGRLAADLNHIGTVRLAALMEIHKLHEVGIKYRGILRRLLKLRYTRDWDDGITLREELEEVQAEMKLLESGQVVTEEGTEAVKGGEFDVSFWYRLERASYYIQQFRSKIESLHPAKVLGFQTLGELVERRLGDAFSNPGRLERRYNRIKRDISELQQRAQISDIREIQEWGEFALIGALVPYYLINVLSHIIREAYMPLISVLLWSIFVAGAAGRLMRNKWYFVGVLFVAIPVWAVLKSSGFTVWEKENGFHQIENEQVVLQKDSAGELKAINNNLTQQNLADHLNGISDKLDQLVKGQKALTESQKPEVEPKNVAPVHAPSKHPKRASRRRGRA
jgi:hypothetical protein